MASLKSYMIYCTLLTQPLTKENCMSIISPTFSAEICIKELTIKYVINCLPVRWMGQWSSADIIRGTDCSGIGKLLTAI